MYSPLYLLGFVMMLYGASAEAAQVDWMSAANGIATERGVAYSGCSQAVSATDSKARKVALMRAQANIARMRSTAVSGEERLSVNSGAGNVSRYSLSVVEESDDFILPLVVMEEELVVVDNVSNFCVLVIEQKPGV